MVIRFVLTILLVGMVSGLMGGPETWADARAVTEPGSSTAVRVTPPVLLEEGRYVYERNCLVCHGRWGDGRGEMSLGMWPKPRKFAPGLFKFRSTPSGFLPTDADLERTIRGGLYGTSMPAFQQLGDQELKAVIQYVKSFSTRWGQKDRYADPVPIPAPPDWLDRPETRRHRALLGGQYFAANCTPCHGAGGKGDGPAAASLEDQWGQSAPPTDLTLPSIRSGPGLRDLYRVLVTGLDGTPMPSFLEATTEDDRWNLVAYLDSLRAGSGKE